MIYFLSIMCILSQIVDISPNEPYEIEIVTKKKESFIILAKNTPVTMTVEGPTYLRVYTRIPWYDRSAKYEIYKVILQENEIDEKIITLESEKSDVSKGEKGNPVSKWRSFYIEVPQGLNTYKLIHWSSPRDTILVKVAYESPKQWRDIAATEYSSTIETIEEEQFTKYYELPRDGSVTLRIKGPTRLKVISRLNYDTQTIGEQNYTLIAEDNGTIEKFALTCHKSEIITFENRKDIVPSDAQRSYIDVGDGWHALRFRLSGAVAQSISLRFQVEE
jgi:hypothetical protein